MKKSIFKIIYAILIFVLALFLTDRLINKGNADMTMEMKKAEFPLVYVERGEQKLNWLHGYRQEMNLVYQNETITAINQNDRKLVLGAELYDNQISGVHYEVRTVDGSRLVEDTEVLDYLSIDNQLDIDITLKDLYEKDKQYSFCLQLKLAEGKTVYYYTRIMFCEDADHVDDHMAFAIDFHEKTFDKEKAKDITKYIESNADGDNTTFSKVNIHSSFSQITWGNLNVKREMEPQVYIRQINPNVCRVELSYIVSMQETTKTNYYNVTEYYYSRLGQERMYLLDYERNMNSIFESDNSIYTNNKISLGITSSDFEMMESNDGNSFSFVKENRLYNFNLSNNKLALLFGFYDEDNADKRVLYNNSRIHIISVDETGNTRFLVYGYMNRGDHEGSVGVACYYFNSMLNTIEEEIYIPYDASAQFLYQDIKQLAYVNNNNQLFLLLNGSVYKIDLASQSFSVLIDNLTFGSYRVSPDNMMIAWQVGDDVNHSNLCKMVNLSTGREKEIEAGNGKYIKPLGFLNDDLIYGVAYSTDLFEDIFGTIVFPMHSVKIQDEEGNVLKNYEKSGIYVTGADVSLNQVNLERIEVSGNGYREIDSDQIMQDVDGDSAKNYIEVVPTQDLEKVVQIAVKSNIKVSALKYLTPKQVMYEGLREVAIVSEIKEQDCFYVYDKYGICEVAYHAGEAVSCADETAGYVMNAKGQCIWEKSNRSNVNQIMRITADASDENRSTLAVCLDTMLNYEGAARDAKELLAQGKSPLSILRSSLSGKQVLELSGCSLNSVLYYVSKDTPVLVLLKDGNAVLIVGYNELNTVLLNPATGKIAKMGMNDSKDFFEANGNQFVTYIKLETDK